MKLKTDPKFKLETLKQSAKDIEQFIKGGTSTKEINTNMLRIFKNTGE